MGPFSVRAFLMYLSGDLELSGTPEPGITILSQTPAHKSGGGSGRREPLRLGDTVSIHYAARLASSSPESDPFDSTRPLHEKAVGEQEGRGQAASEGGGGVGVDEEGRVLDPEFFDVDISTTDDTDQDGASPFRFTLGAHSVINGLETAVLQHMTQPGDRLTVLMPSGTAYGSLGAGDGVVPPYEDLNFEVELVEVTRAEGGHTEL